MISLRSPYFVFYEDPLYAGKDFAERIRYIIKARKLDVNYVDPETGLSLLHVAVYHGMLVSIVSCVRPVCCLLFLAWG